MSPVCACGVCVRACVRASVCVCVCLFVVHKEYEFFNSVPYRNDVLI